MDLDKLNVRDFLEEAAARNPDQPFLIWQDEEQTYADFVAEVDTAAAVWRELGVRKGDRVAFMADNSPGFLHAWLGLAKIGGILVAINTGFKLDEASYLVEHSEAVAALVDPRHTGFFTTIQRSAPTLRALSTLGAADSGFTDFTQAMAQVDRAPRATVDLAGDDVISLIYTSGTTGRPKGVMQTHRNYVLTGQAYPYWMGMNKGDRIYACLPLFHINSQAYSTMGAIGAEGAIVLAPRFSASGFWPEVRRHRVNVFNFIGAMAVIMSKSEPSPSDADNEVRVAYGVPALPQDVREQVEQRFKLDCVSGFGMSETTFGLLEPRDVPRKPGTMGVPRHHPDPSVPETEARVVDKNGNDLGPGQVGELVVKNAAMMLGYFKDPERTAEALRDGWLYTGDSAWRDEDGWFYFVDRVKDIIRRRGENVSSLEVEQTLDAHPAVRQSAVIGVPSELLDEDICAIVVPQPGQTPTAAELIEWCTRRLARFKVPRYIEFVTAIPMTPTSKIEKHRLRSGDYARGERFDIGEAATRLSSSVTTGPTRSSEEA
ncbi:AMP-binding protein [Kibdelosporangium aridum]|uniref:Crotonobetaine/carnitine-CoA ligase n=1 Tax=Kibdelosporangium aridum TaxID=2030 RepID=A0A1Y5Y050_KIBAR|nr:AMP-binding protein [Kibdelosporangium aridum]SMD22921.1 crotonobetaine/carnitine-CoA ligase [Kibdelosporangium aridum]